MIGTLNMYCHFDSFIKYIIHIGWLLSQQPECINGKFVFHPGKIIFLCINENSMRLCRVSSVEPVGRWTLNGIKFLVFEKNCYLALSNLFQIITWDERWELWTCNRIWLNKNRSQILFGICHTILARIYFPFIRLTNCESKIQQLDVNMKLLLICLNNE